MNMLDVIVLLSSTYLLVAGYSIAYKSKLHSYFKWESGRFNAPQIISKKVGHCYMLLGLWCFSLMSASVFGSISFETKFTTLLFLTLFALSAVILMFVVAHTVTEYSKYLKR